MIIEDYIYLADSLHTKLHFSTPDIDNIKHTQFKADLSTNVLTHEIEAVKSANLQYPAIAKNDKKRFLKRLFRKN